jgi:hypothetical protein
MKNKSVLFLLSFLSVTNPSMANLRSFTFREKEKDLKMLLTLNGRYGIQNCILKVLYSEKENDFI